MIHDCNCVLKSIIVVGFNLFDNRNHLIVTIRSGFKSLSPTKSVFSY